MLTFTSKEGWLSKMRKNYFCSGIYQKAWNFHGKNGFFHFFQRLSTRFHKKYQLCPSSSIQYMVKNRKAYFNAMIFHAVRYSCDPFKGVGPNSILCVNFRYTKAAKYLKAP